MSPTAAMPHASARRMNPIRAALTLGRSGHKAFDFLFAGNQAETDSGFTAHDAAQARDVGPRQSSGEGARVMVRFDFTSQVYLRDPATELAKLRAAGPVVGVRFPI